jgi:hypothetical protein
MAALLVLAGGCAGPHQTEDLLAASGFKIIPANTPEQQTHLKTLPNHKISMVQRNGKEYFVYPDAEHNVLYVGQNAQYQQYQKLREQRQLAQERANSNMLLSDPGWDVWGPWPDTIYAP